MGERGREDPTAARYERLKRDEESDKSKRSVGPRSERPRRDARVRQREWSKGKVERTPINPDHSLNQWLPTIWALSNTKNDPTLAQSTPLYK
jgi:hypothetical protein